MAGTNLGTAYVQIVPSAKGIEGSISNVMSGEASAAGEKSGGLFSKIFSSKIGKGVLVAGGLIATGIGVGTAALKKGIQETAAYGDNVDKMSQKLGLSTDAYQKWDYVLNLAGTDMQSMTTGLKTLTNQFQAAKDGNQSSIKAFEQLGISMEDAANMSREDLFGAAIKGLQGMSDSTERAALANKLFGKSGQNLTPLFNQTAEKTQEQMDLAERYGMVMPEAAVKASAAFTDSVTTMQMTMTGMKNRMMAEFLPAVTQITDGLGKMFAGDMSGVDDVVAGIKGMAAKIVQLAPTVLQAAMQISKQLLAGILSKAPEIGTKVGDLLGKIVKWVINKAPAILAAGGKLIINLAKGLISQLPSISASLVRIGAVIVRGLGSALWGKVRSAAVTLKNKFMEPVNQIKDKVKAVLNKVKSYFPLRIGRIFSNLKIPHIKVSGGKAPFGIGGMGTKPSISVSWYARGGVFDNPSLIGVGEAGREIVTPEALMRRVVREEGGGGNISINVYASDGMNVNELAAAVEKRLIEAQKRRKLAWV